MINSGDQPEFVMRACTALSAAALLAACAAPAPLPTSPVPLPPVHFPDAETNGDDCAVIAAIAREHYRFGLDNPALPLWLDGEGSGWAPRCDWARLGVSFPSTYDPDRTGRPDSRARYVQFRRPRYDGRGAVVDTSLMHRPLAGMGYECRVMSGFAGWTVGECRQAWIS